MPAFKQMWQVMIVFALAASTTLAGCNRFQSPIKLTKSVDPPNTSPTSAPESTESTLASETHGNIKFWNLQSVLIQTLNNTPKFENSVCSSDVFAIALSPQGKTLASGNCDTINFWNLHFININRFLQRSSRFQKRSGLG